MGGGGLRKARGLTLIPAIGAFVFATIQSTLIFIFILIFTLIQSTSAFILFLIPLACTPSLCVAPLLFAAPLHHRRVQLLHDFLRRAEQIVLRPAKKDFARKRRSLQQRQIHLARKGVRQILRRGHRAGQHAQTSQNHCDAVTAEKRRGGVFRLQLALPLRLKRARQLLLLIAKRRQRLREKRERKRICCDGAEGLIHLANSTIQVVNLALHQETLHFLGTPDSCLYENIGIGHVRLSLHPFRQIPDLLPLLVCPRQLHYKTHIPVTRK